MKVNNLIAGVEIEGNVMNFSKFDELSDFDEIIRCLDRQSKHTENIIYCSLEFYKAVRDMLNNLVKEMPTVGCDYFFNCNVGGIAYLSDLSFRRGKYDFFLIVKPIDRSVVCPVESDGEEHLLSQCILIEIL